MGESMPEKNGRKSWVMVNRAPILTLWAAVGEVLGGQRATPEYAQR